MKTEVTLATIAADYLAAKKVEDEAISNRRKIGKLLEDAMPGPAEGTVSAKLGDIKISITRKVTRSIDSDSLENAWDFLPANITKAFKWKADLNMKHFRALQELSTDELVQASKFITAKPGASSISVEGDMA